MEATGVIEAEAVQQRASQQPAAGRVPTGAAGNRRPTSSAADAGAQPGPGDAAARPVFSNVAWRVLQNIRVKIGPNRSSSIAPEDVELRPVGASQETFDFSHANRRQTLTRLPRSPLFDSTRRDVDLSALTRVARVRDFTITLTEYDASEATTTHRTTLDEARELLAQLQKPSTKIRWVHLSELSEDVLLLFADALQLNTTAVQDALYFPQRPALATFDNSLFAVMQVPSLEDPKDCLSGLNMLQLSVFLCQGNIVLTMTLEHTDMFSLLRQKLRLPTSALRQGDSSFLLNAIAAQVLVAMKAPMDPFGDMLSDLEQDLVTRAERSTVRKIHFLRRELGMLRRQVWPTRELLSALQQSSSALISQDTRKYLNSTYDTVVQLIDLLETYRELGNGLLELFATRTSKQLGHIIRTVTIFQVLFLPAIFFAAVYGMNFKQGMWELEWVNGYYFFWGLICSLMLVVLCVFRYMGWL